MPAVSVRSLTSIGTPRNGPSAGVVVHARSLGDEEVELRVRRLDARDRLLGELARRDVAVAHLRGEAERVGQSVLPFSSQTGPCVATWRDPDTARRTSTLPGSAPRRSARGSVAPSPARRRTPARARSGSGARRASRRGAGCIGCRAPPPARRSRSTSGSSSHVADRSSRPAARRPRGPTTLSRSRTRVSAPRGSAAWDPESESAAVRHIAQKPREVVGARGAAVARNREQKHSGSGAVRPARAEQRGRPVRGRAILQREAQLRLRPPARKLGSNGFPLVGDGSRRKTYTARRFGQGREEDARQRGDAARVPARDAPDPPLRGEGRGAVPRRRAPGLPARRDRPGGRRGRRLPGDGRGRRLRLDPPRARPHARARHAIRTR